MIPPTPGLPPARPRGGRGGFGFLASVQMGALMTRIAPGFLSAGFARRILTAGAIATLLGTAPALALVPGGGGGTDPQGSPPDVGPTLPYISGRLAGPAAVAATPPAGAVVPDEFCLGDKLTDCGGHLPGGPDAGAAGGADSGAAPNAEAFGVSDAAPGTVFFGDPAQAFAEARNSAWIEGQLRTTVTNSGLDENTVRSFSIGADHRFGDKLIFGLMAVSSNSREWFAASTVEDLGTGVLVGPYFALTLSDNWSLDGRVVGGRISHTVNTAGSLSAQYSGLQGFAALRFSGEYERPDWRFLPAFELASQLRQDDAYIDGVRGPVAASTRRESFATGSLLAYYDGLEAFDGSLSPYAGFELSTQLGGGAFGVARVGLSKALAGDALLNLDYSEGALGLGGTTDRRISLRIEIPF